MLCFSLAAGDYFTVNDNIVVQVSKIEGSYSRLTVEAPREIPVFRGKLRERKGMGRPSCVYEPPFRGEFEIPWDESREEALGTMREVLSEMEDSEDVRKLKEYLDILFPPEEPAETEPPEAEPTESELAGADAVEKGSPEGGSAGETP